MRVESVDFARERLLVRANAVNVAGKMSPGTPKGHDSRSVAFPHFLAALLQVECRGKLPGELVFRTGFDCRRRPTRTANSPELGDDRSSRTRRSRRS